MAQTRTVSPDAKELGEKILAVDNSLSQICQATEAKIERLDVVQSEIGSAKKAKVQETVERKKAELKDLKKQIDIDTVEANKEFAKLNKLKRNRSRKELLADAKEHLMAIKENIRNEKRAIKEKYANEVDKKAAKIAKKSEYAAVNQKYHDELTNAEAEYGTYKKNASKLMIVLTFIILSVAAFAIALIVNYIVYYPKTNNDAAYSFNEKQGYVAVAICVVMICIAIMFAFFLLKDGSKRLASERKNNSLVKGMIIGFVTDFFDTIGIGSFAPTVVMIKLLDACDDDKKIPGVLNAGHTIPVIVEAAIFISAVQVDIATLVILIAASVIGGYLGALLVNKVNKILIKLIMGIILVLTAILMILNHPTVNIFKSSGAATGFGFDNWKLYVTAIIFVILGALMSFGIGLYAPSMAVISLMGMDVTMAFPIMMGSTAFLMPFGSLRFIQDRNYAPKLTLGINMGGVTGVVASFLIVFVGIQVGGGVDKADFVNGLTWVVIAVIFYAAYTMINGYIKATKAKRAQEGNAEHQLK